MAQKPHSKNKNNKLKNLQNEVFDDQLESILNKLPPEEKKTLTALIVSRKVSFSGPLPPPEILEKYNSVVKNGAERIFAMAENQSTHRIELEKFVIKTQIKQSGRGQILAFIIGIVGLLLSTGLAISGFEKVAIAFAITTVGGLVSAFLGGKHLQSKDLDEKK